MIKLNLLEKKKPFLLPVVLGIDLNAVNLKMLGLAIAIYYVPGITNSILFDTNGSYYRSREGNKKLK